MVVQAVVIRALLVLAVLVWAWWVVALPPFSGSATVGVVSGGLAGAAYGWWRRPARGPSPSGNGPPAAPWAMLATAATFWQLQAYLQHPRADHPTISSLVNVALGSRPLRAAALVLWVVAMVALAKR